MTTPRKGLPASRFAPPPLPLPPPETMQLPDLNGEASPNTKDKQLAVRDIRPRAQGKFIHIEDRKFLVKGVSYGAFEPDVDKREYHDLDRIDRDFEQMAANGFNTVRIPHTMPPRALLDIAQRHGLMVMVGLSAEQYVGYLIDRHKKAPDIEEIVREKVRSVAGHPALLCYAIGNEIVASVVRWLGRRRVERYLHRIFKCIRQVDPDGLVTYVNYPTTEFLQLPFLDLVSFNVYLESKETLHKYLARLQNIACDRPLLMSEVGLDAMRNGEAKQAEMLDWQIRTSFSSGCAGVVIFSWTDEWFRGGAEVDDWAFGLTDRDRIPKPALTAVSRAFEESPFPASEEMPRFSVVVCSYNGSRTLRECLAGILRLDYPDFEVIVVNDGSTDETKSIASSFEGIRLISTENMGLSHARNVGLNASTGTYVAYIDDDAWPDSHWLQYLAFAFQQSSHTGIGGPNFAPPSSGFVERCVDGAPGGPLHVLLTDDTAEHIPGCNMTFRKADLEAIGGFDVTYRIAGDDVDVCWQILKQGWTLGFHASAQVWHLRRNSISGYLKQQLGYGKAEALLEDKWPEKYNGLGHVSWGGRVYGNGIIHLLGRNFRVYHGEWGSAPFQNLHQSPPHPLFCLCATPEWWLVVGGFSSVGAFGFLWPPFFIAWAIAAAALGLLLVQAGLSLRNSGINSRPMGPLRRGALMAVTYSLHLLQPLSRLYGRLRHGLFVCRRRIPPCLAIPRQRQSAFFSRHWIDPIERLRMLERQLISVKACFQRGGDFDPWDFEVIGGTLGGARALMAIEDQGSGTQYVRARTWPVCRSMGVIPTILLSVISLIAWLQGFPIATGVLGFLCLALLYRMMSEAASAQVAILDGLAASQLGDETAVEPEETDTAAETTEAVANTP
jgi:glycosyltransferase involved in cell wall biosynthesis